MTKYNQETGKHVCEACGEYSDINNRKVNMHEIRCKKKHEPETEEEIMQQDEREREKPDRRERVPFGFPQKKLHAPSDDGFHYRVFNDGWAKEPGRIQRAQRAGYEIVEGWETLPVGTNDDGSPIKGVLMRIPDEWYEEDQKAKQREVDKIDEAVKKGTIEKQQSDLRYSPDGIKVWASHNENK